MTTAEAVGIAFTRDYNPGPQVWPDRPRRAWTPQWMTFSRPTMAEAFAKVFCS